LSQKFIILLGAAQTILLLALLVKVIGLESSIAEQTTEHPIVTEETIANDNVLGQPVISTQSLSEKRLRQIVREEVSSQFREFGASLTHPSIIEEPDPVSATEYQFRYESAMQELDYFLKQGEISDADMAKLQTDIAKLGPDGRTQMLRRLTQALNSGELRGRL